MYTPLKRNWIMRTEWRRWIMNFFRSFCCFCSCCRFLLLFFSFFNFFLFSIYFFVRLLCRRTCSAIKQRFEKVPTIPDKTVERFLKFGEIATIDLHINSINTPSAHSPPPSKIFGAWRDWGGRLKFDFLARENVSVSTGFVRDCCAEIQSCVRFL